jgi:UDP-glucose:(heptosyl)LPS alpha-1,3-glucosyltransferase
LIRLLEAVATIGPHNLRLLIVGRDDPTPYRAASRRNAVAQCVVFLPPRSDVEFYYSAADAYVGPSLEDAFGLPPLEAMACGLPVIVSSRSGVSEVITDGVDGFVLKDPNDVASLAKLISALQNNPALRQRLGDNAARTAREYTWERNAAQLSDIFEHAIKRLGYQNGSPIPDLQ